jgi:predicted nucleic acid-binding protein
VGRARGPRVRTVFCDTNVLIRLLTGDPPDQAASAARALDAAVAGRFTVIVPDLVVAEVAYVLGSSGVPAAEGAVLIGRLLTIPGVEVVDRSLVHDALRLWSSGRLDFANAYLAALGRRISESAVLSFDRDLDGLEGVTRMDPAAVEPAR